MPSSITCTKDNNQEKDQNSSYIIKIPHIEKFTTISNGTILDKRLTPKATCYLLMMISFKSDWRINVSHLATLKNKGGVKVVRSALTELEKFGYVFSFQPRDKNGRVLPRVYIISEVPKSREEMIESASNLPCHPFRHADMRHTVNAPLINTNKNKDVKKEKERKKKVSASEDAIFLFNIFEKEVNKVRVRRDLKEIRVKSTKAEFKAFDDLLRERDREIIFKVIKETFKNEWWHDKMDTPVFFKKHVTKLEMQAADSKKIFTEDNRKTAQDFYEKYKQKALKKNTRIELSAQEIEFIHVSSSAQPLIILYNSKDFKNQLYNIKRKINLN